MNPIPAVQFCVKIMIFSIETVGPSEICYPTLSNLQFEPSISFTRRDVRDLGGGPEATPYLLPNIPPSSNKSSKNLIRFSRIRTSSKICLFLRKSSTNSIYVADAWHLLEFPSKQLPHLLDQCTYHFRLPRCTGGNVRGSMSLRVTRRWPLD